MTLEHRFLVRLGEETVPRYNVAPAQDVLAVVPNSDGGRKAVRLRWGLVPSWAREPKAGPINARAETAAEKPMFRQSIRRRGCLILADGFYEWDNREPRKQPYLFRLEDEAPFAFAGLWERWEGPGGPLLTCCLLTARANELVAPIHDRIPVILRPEWEASWLDLEIAAPRELEPALEPYPAEEMQSYPVSTRVNCRGTTTRNASSRCIHSRSMTLRTARCPGTTGSPVTGADKAPGAIRGTRSTLDG
ncbi:MAG TPA: SOS response-associated peptidase [Calditerricola sp.]